MPAPGKVKLTVDVTPEAKRRLETLKAELRFTLPDVPRSFITESAIVAALLEAAIDKDVKDLLVDRLFADSAPVRKEPRGATSSTARRKTTR